MIVLGHEAVISGDQGDSAAAKNEQDVKEAILLLKTGMEKSIWSGIGK